MTIRDDGGRGGDDKDKSRAEDSRGIMLQGPSAREEVKQHLGTAGSWTIAVVPSLEGLNALPYPPNILSIVLFVSRVLLQGLCRIRGGPAYTHMSAELLLSRLLLLLLLLPLLLLFLPPLLLCLLARARLGPLRLLCLVQR